MAAEFLAISDEKAGGCRLTVRETEPRGGDAFDVFRQLIVDVEQGSPGAKVQTGFGVRFQRGIVLKNPGSSFRYMSYPLSYLQIRVGTRRVDIETGRPHPPPPGTIPGIAQVDPATIKSEIESAVNGDIQARLTIASTGESEVWTMPPLTNPEDAKRLAAFQQCVRELHVPARPSETRT